MKHLLPLKAIAIGLILNVICFADNYTISLYFEQTEDALSTLFRTQGFPHPLGNHDGDDYDIYLWNPAIDIEPGTVNFNFTIYADIVIAGTPIQYDYLFNIPLNIPSGELSITGIITFLEGIPAQINGMDGPQWVKDIIIDEYEGLELTVYPNSLLEDANASIPELMDITVGDIAFTWEASTDLLRFSLTVEVVGNSPWINGQWKEITGTARYDVRFNSNVEEEVLFVGIYNILGGHGETENPGITTTPEVWSNPVGVDWNYNNIPSGQYRCKVLFGSTYGWFAIYYVFSNLGESGWNPMSIYQTL